MKKNEESVIEQETVEPKIEVQKEEVKEEKKLTVMDTKASSILDPNEYAQMKVLSNDLFKSGALPKGYDNVYKVMASIQVGSEMGLKPFESINSLYMVNGQFSLWGKATIRQVRKHGWRIEYTDEDDKHCTATIKKGDEEYTSTFNFDDAAKSGYTLDGYGKLKFGWKEGINRKLKLRYGVLSILIKTYIPEVLGSAIGIAEIDMDAMQPEIEKPELDVTEVIDKINAVQTMEDLKVIFMELEPAFIKDKRVIEAKDKKKKELEVSDGE